MRARNLAGPLVIAVSAACCTLSSVDDEGMSVEVGMVAPPPTETTFETDLGYQVTVVSGFVAIASVKISLCDEAQAAGWRGPGALDALGSWLRIREAAAHSASSPTLLGVPGVLPLVPNEAFAADLGELLPPPGRYCSTRVALGPADNDAVMAPSDGSMVGQTLLVEGSYVAPGGGEPVDFRWESSATPSSDLPTAFELREDGRHQVREELGVTLASIFDGIDLATIDPAIGADRVAARIAETLQVELPASSR